MERITISLDEELLAVVDGLCRRRGYTSRSEAFRDMVREAAARPDEVAGLEGDCFAALSYVYDHETRDLARRLTESQHHEHDLSVSTLHVHISDRDCLEVAVLKGPVESVRRMADGIVTQRGVRFGHLHVVPVERSGDDHEH